MKFCHQNEALSQELWFTLYKPVISEETLKKFLDEDNIKTNFWNLFKIFVQKNYIEPKVLKVDYMTMFSCPWNCFGHIRPEVVGKNLQYLMIHRDTEARASLKI